MFNGTIEVRKSGIDDWSTAVILDPIVSQDLDSLGCLFGVENYANFDPVAANRGRPSDVSDYVFERLQAMRGPVSQVTHVSAGELAAVDWDQTARERDERLSLVSRDGTVVEKFLQAPKLEGELETFDETLARGGRIAIEKDGDELYLERRLLTRREALSESWSMVVMDLLPLMTERFSDDDLRLVAWFT